MNDFQQKKKIRKNLYSRNVVIILTIITILIVRGTFEVVGKMRDSKSNVIVIEKELERARLKNVELTENINFIETDAGIEREIRQKFSVTKEGEEVAVIIEKENKPTTTEVIQRGFWSSIGHWFISLFH